MDEGLNLLRNQIDTIDKSLLELFYKRMDVCRQVADYKKENKLPVFQGNREKEILDNVRKISPDNLEDASVFLITAIMDISKVLQQREIFSDKKFIDYKIPQFEKDAAVGCPGTVGANSHTASLNIFPENKISFFENFEDVCKAVESGEIKYGILPIHNSTAGSVIQTYELLEKYDLYICASTCVEVKHCLAAKKGTTLSDFKDVYSHPQALSQCSNYLKENGFTPKSYSNTALAAEMIANSDIKAAAICSEHCAEIFGLDILKKCINNVAANFTKFICVTKECMIAPMADTLSIMLTLPNQCGSLQRLLTKFMVNNLNMKKIESRPLKNGSYDFSFHIEFEGSVKDKNVISLLHDLKNNTENFKFFGNYYEI